MRSAWFFITASEEQDESVLSSCPSEDVSKGLMGAPTLVGAVNALYTIRPRPYSFLPFSLSLLSFFSSMNQVLHDHVPK